jgi:excisionase family DNA binding protein
MVRQRALQSTAVQLPLVGIDAVALQLGVSRDTVYRLIRRGELIPYRVGHRLRFKPEELAEYLEQHRERPVT